MKIDQAVALSSARPYARAALEQAIEENQVAEWEILLQSAARISADDSMAALLSRPGVSRQALGDIYTDLLSDLLSPSQRRFIQLLASYGRLPVLDEIARLFQAGREAHDQAVTVRVRSAVPLDDWLQQKLASALASRLQQKVTLVPEVDPGLLGGVEVRVGDRVLDGTVRGKLQRMAEFVSGKGLG